MPVLRSPRFAFWMGRFALVAILLLAVMPTVTRWLASGEARGTAAMAPMRHSGDGAMRMPGHLMPGADKTPAPAGAMHHGGCAYCPLLASLLPILLILTLRLLRQPHASARPPRAVAPRAWPLLRGLGARGPPILL